MFRKEISLIKIRPKRKRRGLKLTISSENRCRRTPKRRVKHRRVNRIEKKEVGVIFHMGFRHFTTQWNKNWYAY
jgi:hypothetical protein